MIGDGTDGTDPERTDGLRPRLDGRAAATALSHVLVIGITAIFLSGLLVGLSTFVDGQQDASTREQLQTIGNRIADELSRVDQLGVRGGRISITAEFPERVNQRTYAVEIVDPSACDSPFAPSGIDACLELDAARTDVTVYVPLNNRTALSLADADGGAVRLQSNGLVSGSPADANRGVGRRLSPRVGVAKNIGDFGFNTSFRDFNSEPTPEFNVTPPFPTSDTTITFDGGSSTDPDGSIVTYEWDLDDDGSYEATGEQITRTLSPGDYTVRLAVTDNKGATVLSGPENISVSGLEYRDDLRTVGGDDEAVTLTLYNEWDESITLSELFVDPKDDSIDEIIASGGNEIEFDIDGAPDAGVDFEDPDGNAIDRDIPDSGVIVDLDQPDDETEIDGTPRIPANEEVEVTIDEFDTDMDGENLTIAVDYLIDGGSKTTRFADTAAPGISNYRVVASGQDIDLAFESSTELDVSTITVERGGAVSTTTLPASNFSESVSGGTWQYTADVASGVTGTVYAELTAAEDTSGVASPDPPFNDTATGTTADYRWNSAFDWNNNNDEARVVHDSFGDRQADRITLGYPNYDRLATRFGGPQDLLGYWTFDEDSGDTVADVTGNGFDGEVKGFGNTDASKNDPTRGVTGIHGTSSWKFNDDSDSEDEVFVDDDPALRGGNGVEVTATAWVNFGGSIDVDSGRASILGKQQGLSQGDWGLMVTDQSCPSWADCSGSPPYVGYYGEDGDDYGLFAEMPSDSQWHHVAVQVNDDEDEVTVLIDGEVEAQTFSAPDDFSGATTHPVEIGRTEYQEANLEGKVDEVRLYGRELLNDEVDELYEAGTSGAFTTSLKTGPTVDPDDLAVTHSGTIDSGESVTVEVYGDCSGGCEYYGQVDLTSDSNTQSLGASGNSPTDNYVLVAELDSPSPAGAPVIDSLGLVDTS
jgi:hypothetical protein